MPKFYGKVGFVVSTETSPGVWTDVATEKDYYGDRMDLSQRWQSADKLNDNSIIKEKISILADAFANEHFSSIKYVEWMGVKWKVVEVTPQRPRILLTLGGEYNGQQTISA